MKIYVDESRQEVRIEWGGKHKHYTRVSPKKDDREDMPRKALSINLEGSDSKVVYETPGYTTNKNEVLAPGGDYLATAWDPTQAQKIADALNASKED